MIKREFNLNLSISKQEGNQITGTDGIPGVVIAVYLGYIGRDISSNYKDACMCLPAGFVIGPNPIDKLLLTNRFNLKESIDPYI